MTSYRHQKWTKIRFRPPGLDHDIEGLTVLCNWMAETDKVYYVTKSLDSAHRGYYRVYSDRISKVFAPPPRADGMAL